MLTHPLFYPYLTLSFTGSLRVHNGFMQYLYNILTIPLQYRYHSDTTLNLNRRNSERIYFISPTQSKSLPIA